MITEPNNTPYDFGNVAALSDVFSETKKLRRARLPAHIMVVEDDALTRRIVTGCFKENYAMISASNAQEAVADYLLHAPDVVFLDIGLPDTDGFAVLDLITALDPDAFIVMFSSNSYEENVSKAMKMGAKGFIPKPFKKETLQQFIHGSAPHYHKSA